jgi:hypothetical protein
MTWFYPGDNFGQEFRYPKRLAMLETTAPALVGDNASQHTRREMLDMIEKSIATVYAVGLYDADDPDRNPGILRELAKISGGEAYFPENSWGMVSIFRRIAKDIRTRYTIGYVPQVANGTSSLRRIRIQVSAPDHIRLRARTRSSYRYDDVSNPGNK